MTPTLPSPSSPDAVASVLIPIRTVNPLNQRRHHWVVAKAAKAARAAAIISCHGRLPTTRPATVRLTRLSPGELDSDAVPAALKSVRDGIADVFGCGDGPKDGIMWLYAQEKSKTHAVRVEVM